MAEISVSAAIGAGFGLIRTKPLTVLGWGLAQVAVVAVAFIAFAPMWLSIVGEIGRRAAEGAQPDPSAFMGRFVAFQGMIMLVNFGMLFARAVMSCAVYRSILHPQQSGFLYLRVGAPELYLFLLTVGLSYAIGFAVLIPMIPIAIVIGGLVAGHAYAAAIGVGAVSVLALIAAAVYLALRFSLVGPMMVQDGKFHLMESWTLTKGKFGALLATGLVLFLMILALEFVVVGIIVGIALGAAVGLHGQGEAWRAMLQHPGPELPLRIAPWLLLFAVIFAPLTGALYAVLLAPWARILRDLTENDAQAAFV